MSASHGEAVLARDDAASDLVDEELDPDAPVEVLERMLQVAEARRRVREQALRQMPRWRFRRRRLAKQRIYSRHEREGAIRDAIHASARSREASPG